MRETKKADKYFMYCRKSSESEDRQVQSIDSQKKEMRKISESRDLKVIKVFEESRSAKEPGRPEFDEMIERIKKGEADGIIAWKYNRLTRNPIDSGTISWLLQSGTIKHIQASSRSYYSEDNVLITSIEAGMANQYVRDLSTDTKRGLRERVDRGYTHGMAPIGYLNDKSQEPGNRGWKTDKDRRGDFFSS
jgi:DNA invertase Pin-like site-specific DNA recombinase